MKSSFCKNVAALIGALGIDQARIYQTEVAWHGKMETIPRRTLSEVLNGDREPRNETKAILVEVILALHPALRGRLSLPDLERTDFDAKTFLRQPVSPTALAFDVDVLMQMLTEILNSAKSRPELIARFASIPIEGAKLQFWKKLREVLDSLNIETQNFNETLFRAGMPPGIPVPAGGTTLGYAKKLIENPKLLSADQELIWKVATTVYPPFTSKSDPELKAPARWLAKYWDRAVVFARERWDSSIAAELGRRRPQERSQVYLLSWLELPLVTQTGNKEPGKTGLFELGRFFQGEAGPR